VPSFAPRSDPAPAETVFALYRDESTALRQPEDISAHYVIHFTDSLRGLSVGAPVTLFGLTAGEVTSVGLDLDPKTLNIQGRVEIAVYPERLSAHLSEEQMATGEAIVRSQQQRHAIFRNLIEDRGLRAQLQSGNMLTGQLYIAFDFFPDAPPA